MQFNWKKNDYTDKQKESFGRYLFWDNWDMLIKNMQIDCLYHPPLLRYLTLTIDIWLTLYQGIQLTDELQ